MEKANQINEVFAFDYCPKTQKLTRFRLRAEECWPFRNKPYIKVFYSTPETEDDYLLIRKTDFDKEVDVWENENGKMLRLMSLSNDPNNACKVIKTYIYSCWAEAKAIFESVDTIKAAIDEKSANIAEKTANGEYKDLINCK